MHKDYHLIGLNWPIIQILQKIKTQRFETEFNIPAGRMLKIMVSSVDNIWRRFNKITIRRVCTLNYAVLNRTITFSFAYSFTLDRNWWVRNPCRQKSLLRMAPSGRLQRSYSSLHSSIIKANTSVKVCHDFISFCPLFSAPHMIQAIAKAFIFYSLLIYVRNSVVRCHTIARGTIFFNF